MEIGYIQQLILPFDFFGIECIVHCIQKVSCGFQIYPGKYIIAAFAQFLTVKLQAIAYDRYHVIFKTVTRIGVADGIKNRLYSNGLHKFVYS